MSPLSFFYINHRQNHCLHEQEEASHWDITFQPKAKASLFQNYPWLPPWCVGVRCCPYKNVSSIQATLICTWVFIFCRNIQEGINKSRTLFSSVIIYSILHSLPRNLLQKRIFTSLFIVICNQRILFSCLWEIMNKKLEGYPIQTSCKLDKFLSNLILL